MDSHRRLLFNMSTNTYQWTFVEHGIICAVFSLTITDGVIDCTYGENEETFISHLAREYTKPVIDLVNTIINTHKLPHSNMLMTNLFSLTVAAIKDIY